MVSSTIAKCFRGVMDSTMVSGAINSSSILDESTNIYVQIRKCLLNLNSLVYSLVVLILFKSLWENYEIRKIL